MILLIKLLIAHCVGDFVLQPIKWVKSKKKKRYKSPYLYAHIGVHALALLILFGFDILLLPLYLIVIISHYIIDVLKLHFTTKKNERSLFLLDQLAHISVILAVVAYYEPQLISLQEWNANALLLILLAIIALTSVSGIVIQMLMSKWRLEDSGAGHSLNKAGLYIGILERLFVFGFIVLNQWEAIGLLITAKSVFRFGDLSKAKDRKLTEYVLIGTMLSFGLAILIGLGFKVVYSLF